MKQYRGSIEDLKTLIASAGFTIISTEEKENLQQIKTDEGAILNWYKTGTLQYQGNKIQAEKLKIALSEASGLPKAKASSATPPSLNSSESPANNKKVFVVHGHDAQAREQLELVLHKLGLNPFVLQNSSGGGLTIIEALEKEIGPRPGAARFGIVLMTPDDMGYAQSEGADKVQPRARQNVVLEAGMLISALGRSNVAILKKGHLEVPSDAQGIIYIPFNAHVKEAVPKLANRLTQAGFVFNPTSIAHASS